MRDERFHEVIGKMSVVKATVMLPLNRFNPNVHSSLEDLMRSSVTVYGAGGIKSISCQWLDSGVERVLLSLTGFKRRVLKTHANRVAMDAALKKIEDARNKAISDYCLKNKKNVDLFWEKIRKSQADKLEGQLKIEKHMVSKAFKSVKMLDFEAIKILWDERTVEGVMEL